MEENKDLIERYLYDVVRRLPEKQREDIERELRSLIEDMIEEREEAAATGMEESRLEHVKAVLNELGSPARLARNYRGEHDCLIGGEYYDSYCFLLKIVLLCTAAGMVISGLVQFLERTAQTKGFASHLWETFLSIGIIPMALIQAFGFVTLLFALFERKQVRVSVGDTAWAPEKLPQIPYKKALISRGESVVGVVFGILFVVLLTFAPQLFGAWIQKDGVWTSVPIFNLEIWGSVLPLFILSVTLGIVDDFVKLVVGKYTYAVMTVTLVTNMVSFALAVLIFKGYPIWNADFVPGIQALTGKAGAVPNELFRYFNTDVFGNVLVLLLLFAFLLDTGTTVYYTVRYGEGGGPGGR